MDAKRKLEDRLEDINIGEVFGDHDYTDTTIDIDMKVETRDE